MNAALKKTRSLSFPFRRIDCGTIMNGKGLIRMGHFSGCYQGLRSYRKLASLTVTCGDAKAYMFLFSTKRRVHKWTDIQVNLYI